MRDFGAWPLSRGTTAEGCNKVFNIGPYASEKNIPRNSSTRVIITSRGKKKSWTIRVPVTFFFFFFWVPGVQMAFHLRENEANGTHYRASKEDFGEARHNRKKEEEKLSPAQSELNSSLETTGLWDWTFGQQGWRCVYRDYTDWRSSHSFLITTSSIFPLILSSSSSSCVRYKC